mgnify:FL=1
MVPHITYENGQKMYQWRSNLTGHSYKYFVQEYDLEFLTVLFWILLVLGLVAAFVPKEKLKITFNKLRNIKLRKRRNENMADESA